MHAAWIRSARGIVQDLEDVRMKSKTLALLVTKPGCPECAEFENERMYQAEQEASFRGATLVGWHCDTLAATDAARKAGVTDLPALVIVPPSGDLQVLDMSSSRSR